MGDELSDEIIFLGDNALDAEMMCLMHRND